MSIFTALNRGQYRTHPPLINQKKLFDMVKITKSNPNSKRKGVKKEPMPYLVIFQ